MRIRLLLLPAIALGALAPCRAQGDTLRLDTVPAIATRIPGPVERMARHVQVLDARVLERSPRAEVAEALRMGTAIDVRQRGPFDVQTDLGIRGGTYDQALVLVDGIPMSDPQSGHHLMDLPLLADDVERIEVCYGGASRAFGAGALSGAVNLATRWPREVQGRLTAEGGQYGSWRVRGMQEWARGGLGLRLTAFHGRTDGALPNTDHEQSGAHLTAAREWKRVAVRAQAGWSGKRFGAQDFYSTLYPEQQEATRTLIGAFEARHSGTWGWTVRGYFRQHNDRFELFREGPDHYRFSDGYFIRGEADTARLGPAAYYGFHNVHRTRVLGAAAELRRAWQGGTTAVGVHAREEGIVSNVLGRPMAEPMPAAGSRDPYTRADGRRNLAVHLDHQWRRARFTAEAGALLNLSSAFAPELLPGLDLSQRWDARHTTYASASRAFRLPTYTDLYYNRGGAVGSASLRPEHGDQAELGHRVRLERWRIAVAVFVRRGTDLIDWVRMPGEDVVRAANITALTMRGAEAEAVRDGADGRPSLGVAYAWLGSDREAFAFTSLYALDHLRHRLAAWGEQRMRAFALRVGLAWQQRAGTYAALPDGAVRAYPANLRVDARLSWERRGAELFLSGYNLLDAEQMDRANVRLPGRWLTAGITVRWNQKARPEP